MGLLAAKMGSGVWGTYDLALCHFPDLLQDLIHDYKQLELRIREDKCLLLPVA